MRVPRSVLVVGASFLSLLLLSPARAQSSEKPRRLHLGVGADVLEALGNECVQPVDGAADCERGATLLQFSFSASFRVAPYFSIGGRFAAASRNTDVGGIHAPRHGAIWQLSIEPRFYPGGQRRVSPFVGLALGYGSFRETSAEVPERTTHGSLLVGGVIGADFALNDWLALSPEVRLLRMDFAPSASERSDGHSTYYPGKAWFSVGAQLVALLPV